jgi:hypothetical protein
VLLLLLILYLNSAAIFRVFDNLITSQQFREMFKYEKKIYFFPRVYKFET